MKRFTIILSLATLACTHKSEIMHETGIVIAKQYKAKENYQGSSVGFGSQGNPITIHEIQKDEQFAVVFKCQHGVVFTVNNGLAYADCNEKDTVDIAYREIRTKKGALVRYHFESAKPIHNINP